MPKVLKFTIQNNPRRDGILMHNPKFLMKESVGGAGEIATPSEKLSCAEQAKLSRYLTTDEQFLCVESAAVRKSIIGGGKGLMVTVEGQSRKSSLMSLLPGAIGPLSPYFIVRDHTGRLLKADEYVVAKHRIVIGTAGVWRGRAHIPQWRLECAFFYDDITLRDVPTTTIAIKRAGSFPGLLDFRPGSGGSFGTYELVGTPELVELEDFDVESIFKEV